MAVFSRNDSVRQQRALSSAEAALSRIQKCAEAVQDERLTASEAVEQILDELAARSALGQVREALGRSVQPARPH
jgi:septation ring formation regulator EzrA